MKPGPVHRTTAWRRRQPKASRPWPARGRPRGRNVYDAQRLASLRGFVAALISQLNRRGYVSIVDLECASNPTNEDGFRYFPASHTLRACLAECGLSPAALFVAAVDLLPLNAHTARSYRNPLEARRAARFDSDALDRERYSADALHDAVPLAQEDSLSEGYDPRVASEAWADEIDRRLGWSEPVPEPERTAATLRPVGRIPGTPPHRVQLAGGWGVSKRMVAYWRAHPDYGPAMRFLVSLCRRPIPVRPHEPEWQRAAPIVNANLGDALRRRQQARQSSNKF
jgi:hypothetical protein